MTKTKLVIGSLAGAAAIQLAMAACTSATSPSPTAIGDDAGSSAANDSGLLGAIDAMIDAVASLVDSSTKDAKAGGGSDDAGATGTVQYFTTSCSTLVSGVYYAEQAVNDSKGNPVPAATILQVVSASLLYSSPINAPNSSYTIGSGASEMFAKDGFAATYCGSAAGQQALFTVRPQ